MINLKPHHTQFCNGYKKLPVFDIDKPIEYYEVDCRQHRIGFFCDYEPRFFSVGDCFYNTYRDYQLVEKVLENEFKRSVYKFKSGYVPNWENTNWVYEIVYMAGYWHYCIETPISKITNFWIDYDNKDRHEAECHVDKFMEQIRDRNKFYLQRQQFVSTRFNKHGVTITDINFMVNKLNKQANGINQ